MYQQMSEQVVRRLSDGASIPTDPANTDYQRYLEWLAAGGVPEVIEPAEPEA
jgi:hypothetical protein